MYININIIREISKIFKDTTFYLASWRSTDKHASCDILLGILVLLFFAPTWLVLVLLSRRPVFWGHNWSKSSAMPPLVTSSKQLIWSQSKVCLEKLSVAGCEHLPYCAPQFGSTISHLFAWANGPACLPKKNKAICSSQGAHLRCQPLETILQAPMYHSYPIQGTGGCHSTSSRFGGGFLYLHERLRKPKTQPYPTPQRLWCIQWQSVRLKVMFDVWLLLNKNTSPNGCFLSSWLSKSLRSHWGKYGITCHWEISSKLLPSSMDTGKFMYFCCNSSILFDFIASTWCCDICQPCNRWVAGITYQHSGLSIYVALQNRL